jgi:hypothetical protein
MLTCARTMGHCIYMSALAVKALNRDILKTVCYSSVNHVSSVSSFTCSMFVWNTYGPILYFVHLPVRSHQYIVQASSCFFYVSVQNTMSHVTFMKLHHTHTNIIPMITTYPLSPSLHIAHNQTCSHRGLTRLTEPEVTQTPQTPSIPSNISMIWHGSSSRLTRIVPSLSIST